MIKRIADQLLAERRRDAERVRMSRGEATSELVDQLMELYCDWRTRCSEVRTTYTRFAQAGAPDRASAFAAYSAALDREERACDSYAAQIRLIQARI